MPLIPGQPPRPVSVGRASVSDLAQYMIQFHRTHGRPVIPLPSENHQKFTNASKGMGEKRHGLAKPVILFVLLVAQKKLGICPTLNLSKLTSARLRKILKTHLDKILTEPFLVAG